MRPIDVVRLPRPPYRHEADAGSRIRNASEIRRFSLQVASAVGGALSSQRFPVVVGGDCSILLGCLLGARRGGRSGLVHVDGHSDYFHPGNYDVASRLGSVAGMDLALATGLGEPRLTGWPGVHGALVEPRDAIQIGEREALTLEFRQTYGDIAHSRISRFIVQDVLARGMASTLESVAAIIARRRLRRVWLHIDLDVLDEAVMPSVDSPGSPGLNFSQLTELISGLVGLGVVIGMDVAIYDPERDTDRRHAGLIVDCIATGLHAHFGSHSIVGRE